MQPAEQIITDPAVEAFYQLRAIEDERPGVPSQENVERMLRKIRQAGKRWDKAIPTTREGAKLKLREAQAFSDIKGRDSFASALEYVIGRVDTADPGWLTSSLRTLSI